MTTIRTDFPHKVRVIENLWVPMPDGTRLAARVWLPEDAGPVPAILEYIPYRKRDGTRTRDAGLHAYLAGHGYACIRLDIRGTGDSDGILTDEYTPQEQQDGVDAIAWLAAQDWCDGQIAMIGISWGGFNGLQIAALQPPALKTIITVGSTDDRYATDVHYVGGCLSKDNLDWSATMVAAQDLPPDPAIVGDTWRDTWALRLEANIPWGLIWLRHQRRDAYWKQGSTCEDPSRIQIPVYAVSGWADNYSEAVPRIVATLPGPTRGLIGPWAHSYPHDVTVGPAIGWLQEVLRWCDHWMKGRDTGIMNEPALRVWMQDSVPPQTCYRDRPGRWVGEDRWPSPRIDNRILHLGPHGLSPTPAPDTRSICSPLWVGLTAGEVGRYGDDADWPGDQREDDAGSLLWTTPPLTQTTEILGAPTLTITFQSDEPQALVAVRLTDIAPDGRATRVTVGLLNLTHRDSHEHATPLTPGATHTATVELDDIAHSFPPGHRIGVSLSTAYWPIAWPSPRPATLTIDGANSRLTLPVRPPRPEDAALRPFDPPEAAADDPVTHHPGATKHPRRVTRDLLSGQMTVDFPRWTYALTFDDTATTTTSDGFARYIITDGDPLSACCETGYTVGLIRPDGAGGTSSITHASTGRLTCDATHFTYEAEITVTENGAQVFHRRFHDRIPRDHV